MPKARTREKTCSKCGVDIRANTAFCYNCGNRLPESGSTSPKQAAGDNGAAEMTAETESALEDLAKRSKIDDVVAEPKTSLPTATGEDSEVRAEQLKVDEGEDKLAKAAAERKMARIKRRLPAEYVWEPDSDASTRFVVLVALLIAVIAAATVYLTIFWR